MDDRVVKALFTINCVLPIVIMIVSIVIHNRIIKSIDSRLFLRFSVGVIVVSIVLTFFSAYTSYGGFGPGTMLLCGTFIMGFVTAFLLFDSRSLKKERESASDDSRRYLIPLKLILVFAQLLPFFGSRVIYNICDSYHDQQAAPLMLAVENYYKANSEYPDNLEVLIPEYISEVPEPLCLQPYHWIWGYDDVNNRVNYYMLDCGDKKLLAVRDTSLGWVRRYDFATQTWSASDFLDGYCAYLG